MGMHNSDQIQNILGRQDTHMLRWTQKTDQIFPKLQPVVVVCTCCGRSSISS